MHQPRRLQRGFTLIEIVVALAIIGLLIAAIVPIVIQQLEKGRRARVLTDLKVIGDASQQFFTDLSAWPKNCEEGAGCMLTTSTTWSAVGPNQYGATDTALLSKPAAAATWDASRNYGWNGPYIKSGQVSGAAAAITNMAEMKDPWGNSYFYYYSGPAGGPADQGVLVLWSAGADRTNASSAGADDDTPSGGGDDILFVATTRLKP